MTTCVSVRLNEHDMIAAIEDKSIDIMILDFSEVYPEAIDSTIDSVFDAVSKVFTLDKWMLSMTTSREYRDVLVRGVCRMLERHIAQRQLGEE